MLRKTKRLRQWILITVAAVLALLNLQTIKSYQNFTLPLSKTFLSLNSNVDVVYTWVNGSDPKFIKALNKELGLKTSTGADLNRYRDNDQLKYSLRSLSKHAAWVNNIYIVTNGQAPYWLNTTHPKIHMVTHNDIFPDPSHLPTFSSPAIEAHIHRIKGLSNKFLYFNDDFILGANIELTDFETFWHGPKVYLSSNIPSKRIKMSQEGVAQIETQTPQVITYKKKHDPLEDPYVKSLQYTSHIFELFYNAKMKRQIAHMPHLISKQIMVELQTKLSRFYERTSSHKFRDELDIQMAQAYFGHIMFELIPTEDGERIRHKFRYELSQIQQVVMIPITNNINQVKQELILNLKKKIKFFCLNDNLDYSEDVTQVLSLLEEFYKTRYPEKSPFEK